LADQMLVLEGLVVTQNETRVSGGGVSASRFSAFRRAHSASLPGAINGCFSDLAAIHRF